MKNRNAPRSVTPQAQVDPAAADAYYPETIYPTSVRPTPVGSEATDLSQMKVPDGVVMPQVQNFNAYNRYNTPYASNESEPYIVPSNYNYAMTGKPYEKSEDNYYSTPYTPPQYSTQVTDPQIYTNPYYSATHNNTTMMTDSQISNPYAPSGQATVDPITGQYNIYSDPYGAGQTPVSPESVPHNAANPNDMNVNFAQMQISYPKQESTPQPNPNYGADYSQTYYSVQYPQAATPNNATYSHAIQNSNTNMTPSQIPTDYSSLNYPYSGDTYNQQQVQPVQPAEPVPPVVYSSSAEYSYATGAYTNMPQGYTIYTNADSAMTSTTSVSNPAVGVAQYPYQEPDPAVLSQLDAYDKPIKSHVTGEALSNVSFQTPYRSFDQNASSYPNQNIPDQNAQPSTPYSYPDRSVNFVQTYQNHPGYTYNQATGSYDYAYGSQNSCSTSYSVEQPSMVNQTISKDPNLPTHGMYTNAGSCETVQSPSEMTENMLPQQIGVDQTYYNAPYGYQSTDQSNVSTVSSQPVSTNYGASVNQSTYMLSGQGHDTSVTYANDQVSSPKEEIQQPPNFDQHSNVCNEPAPVSAESLNRQPEKQVEMQQEEKQEPSVFDLLSDIDFSVEQKPLMPEIKVPQISEKAIVKPVVVPKSEPVQKPIIKEETIVRPPRRDLFSDPMLLNSFTQEVKELQKLVENFSNKASSECLDAKWNIYRAVQENTSMCKSKSIALKHGEGHKPTDVVPYDDSRLTLKSDPEAYINASYYKQLASWCIPLVISKNPSENDYAVFWKAVLENNIKVVVCLLSEIEMQGNSYWPTAKGQCLELGDVKVTLEDVKCTVHWTERDLTLAYGSSVAAVTHYQITVFPEKIVCPPLVLLADRVLQQTCPGGRGRGLVEGGAWLQGGGGGEGRGCVLALLLMVMCQVRAGHLQLCEMIESGCINLYKNRSNVLEDKKYLVDAYKTALFYVQGVLCSGTTMFNGEAVSVPSGAGVLPPVTPIPAPAPASAPAPAHHKGKFSRESFEEMKQSPGLKSGDMKDPLNFLDPLWSLKKK
ncbi:unnamed protein product [Diatraea saccharalis]|uniref:protein-tyrosine-phosphatase n=1 Tax=Diatraea saccharalis TaxID=40085 RepID=A0A9N9W816_9NEOP|nr:unnamed protein product [Diatraea saccharalis]